MNQANELNIWNIIFFVRRYSRKTALFAFSGALLGIALYAISPKKYTSTGMILPLSKSGMSGMAKSDQTDLASLFGMMNSTTGSDTLMAILSSRTLAEEVINDLNLLPVMFSRDWDKEKSQWKEGWFFKKPAMEDGVARLNKKYLKIAKKKSEPTITIKATFPDAERAQKVAQMYTEGLQKYVQENALTMAKRRRMFLDEQVGRQKVSTLESGKELDEFYSRYHISGERTKIDISVKAQSAVNGKQEQIIARSIPQQVYYEFLNKQKLLEFELTSLLSNQLQLARIEEQREEPAFQIIDRANMPEKPSSPNLKVLAVLGFFLGGVLGLSLGFVTELKKQSPNYVGS